MCLCPIHTAGVQNVCWLNTPHMLAFFHPPTLTFEVLLSTRLPLLVCCLSSYQYSGMSEWVVYEPLGKGTEAHQSSPALLKNARLVGQ